jgi:hypothetical protein
MRVRVFGAVVLLLTLAVAPSVCAQPDRQREQLRHELKERVDRALIAAMRSLRSELHAMIDEELDGATAWPPPGALGGGRASGSEVERALAVCEARLARLSRVLGADDPRVQELAIELEALRGGRLPAATSLLAGVVVIPAPDEVQGWAISGDPVRPAKPFEVALSAASKEFRARHLIPPGVGLRLDAVGERSLFAAAGLVAGDVLVYTTEGPIRGLQDLSEALSRLPAGQDLRIQVIGERSGRRRFVSLPTASAEQARGGTAASEVPEVPAIPDPKAMIDDMLRRAIRQVVPAEGGLIVPAAPAEAGGEPSPPAPERPRERLRDR